MEKIKNLDRRVQISSGLFILTALMMEYPLISRFLHNTILRIPFISDLIYNLDFFESLIMKNKFSVAESVQSGLQSLFLGNGYDYNFFVSFILMIFLFVFTIIKVLIPILGVASHLLDEKLIPLIVCGVQLVYVVIGGLLDIIYNIRFGNGFFAGLFGAAIDNYLVLLLIIVNGVVLYMLKTGKELKLPSKTSDTVAE